MLEIVPCHRAYEMAGDDGLCKEGDCSARRQQSRVQLVCYSP